MHMWCECECDVAKEFADARDFSLSVQEEKEGEARFSFYF